MRCSNCMAKISEIRLQIRRQWCLECTTHPRGQCQLQFGRMQKRPAQPSTSMAIHRIADNRMMYMRGMNPQLVRTASQQTHRQKAVMRKYLDYLVRCLG